MNHDPFRSIAFQPRKDCREFWYRLAKLLKERHGSRIHLYGSTKEEVRFYRELDTDGVFSSFTVTYASLMAWVREEGLDADEVFARARKMEAYTGTTINAIAATDRHLGRGYSPGGYYFPKSRISEETDNVQMVHGITTMLEFWDREIKEKGITLIMGGNKFQGVMARVHGLTWCQNVTSGYRAYEYWTDNEFNENRHIRTAFAQLTQDRMELSVDGRPYQQYLVLHVSLVAYAKFRVFAKDVLTIIAKHYYGRLRGYDKSRMYILSSVLGQKYRRWSGLRMMAREPFQPLSALDGKPFVFFPLQTEPESAFSFVTPDNLSQHHCVLQISRNLPAGMLLAVKEHFLTVSRRPSNFYDQLAELKNVVLLDARAHGIEAVHKAVAVANVVGNAGLEAAMLGKPVITFGAHNNYGFVDHVFQVDADTDLRTLLRDVIEGRAIDQEKAIADGTRLLNAIVSVSFDAGNFQADGTPVESVAAVEYAYRALCGTVDARALGPGAAAEVV